MTDVGREARLTLDAFFQSARHRVEGLRQPAEIRVVELAEAGVERAARDALGGIGNGRERTEDAPGRGATDRGGDERGNQYADGERASEHVERAFELAQREELVVGAAGRRDRDADRELGRAVGTAVALVTGVAGRDDADEVGRKRVRVGRHRRREPFFAISQQRRRRGATAETGHEALDVGVRITQRVAGEAGVDVGLPDRGSSR